MVDRLFLLALPCHWWPPKKWHWLSLPLQIINHWLVALTILKNDRVRQWVSDDIPYMKWKKTAMFETTNSYHSLPLHILNDMVNPMSLMKFTLPRSSSCEIQLSTHRLHRVAAEFHGQLTWALRGAGKGHRRGDLNATKIKKAMRIYSWLIVVNDHWPRINSCC